jgi:hypothetical protein
VGILRCTSCSCQLLLAAWLSGCLLPVLVLSWCPSEYRWSQYLWRGSFSPGRILGWASQICRKGQKPGAGAMVITSQSFCCDSVLASDPYCCTGTLTPALPKVHSVLLWKKAIQEDAQHLSSPRGLRDTKATPLFMLHGSLRGQVSPCPAQPLVCLCPQFLSLTDALQYISHLRVCLWAASLRHSMLTDPPSWVPSDDVSVLDMLAHLCSFYFCSENSCFLGWPVECFILFLLISKCFQANRTLVRSALNHHPGTAPLAFPLCIVSCTGSDLSRRIKGS